MSAPTPATLTRHELNGLRAEVVDATNPDAVGIAGRVVVETAGTLHLDDGDRVRQVPKQGATFAFALGAAAATGPRAGGDAPGATSAGAGAGATHVTVEGDRLLSRPARRTENAGDNTWR